MSLVVPHRTIERFSKFDNPSDLQVDIMRAIGDISGVRVMFNRVLVAIYFRPEKSKGGIIRPDSNVLEDLWQSKVGLVVKMGQDAFVDDRSTSFNGQRVNVGEWCGFKIAETWELLVNEVPCRLVEDANIRVGLSDPRMVF